MRDGIIIRFAEAQAGISGATGEHAVSFLERGTLNLMLSLGKFAPRRPPGEQTVHEQDELYVIVRGQGVLVHNGKRNSFEAGDALMVPAGTKHVFEEFSDDLAVWVIFYGPNGGEVPE